MARRVTVLNVVIFLQSVDLKSYQALQTYLKNVPPSYNNYIHHLTIRTTTTYDHHDTSNPSPTDAIIELLTGCTQVERLTLELDGSLRKDVIPCFARLRSLTTLSIHHVGDERIAPL